MSARVTDWSLRVAARQAVVVDSGPDPRAMDRCLDQLGVAAVPLLVLTHFHADHVDGLRGVWSGRTVGQVWVSPLAAPAYEAIGGGGSGRPAPDAGRARRRPGSRPRSASSTCR